MTIDDAIEIKSRALKEFHPGDPVKLVEADRLSIEALKGIKKVRKTLEPYVTALLPGETEK